MKLYRVLALSPLILVPVPAHAAVLKAAVLACKTPADAEKAGAFRVKKDNAGLEAFSRSQITSRACMTFAKGVTIDVDETKPPLTCIRLSGDLECYWVPDAFIDQHPGEKGGGGGGRKGGGRRSS